MKANIKNIYFGMELSVRLIAGGGGGGGGGLNAGFTVWQK